MSSSNKRMENSCNKGVKKEDNCSSICKTISLKFGEALSSELYIKNSQIDINRSQKGHF